MKNILLDKLMSDLFKISANHDNCFDEAILLYKKQDYQFMKLEQTASKTISIDNSLIDNIEFYEEEVNEDYFREEYDNFIEKNGTINSLLIETCNDIEF